MRNICWIVCLGAALVAAPALAQQKLYRWTDANGQVFYTDKPPPNEARQVEQKKLGSRAGSGPLPYDLQQAMKLFPVTVYASDCGDPCTRARKLLEARGVPFTEKNAGDPVVQGELRKLTGSDSVEVPILVVGRSITRGWEEGQWHSALDAANYPRSSKLPPKTKARQTAAAKDDKAAPAQPAPAADAPPKR